MARVFLSHTGSDDAIAIEVHRWLLECGHEVFLDHNLRDGVRELWAADRDFSYFPALRTLNPLVASA